MITQETIDKVLFTTRVEEVVGDFVSLKRAGSSYKGCCPFHDEKTPSFVVSPAKGIYKCFGCGKAGNSVSFVMEQEKCSFTDAIRYLANKYHIPVIETAVSAEEMAQRDVRESMLAVNRFATEYFEKNMWETEEGKAIGLSYFYERGFTEEIIRKFQLGFCPDKKNAFTEAAIKAGYKLEYLQKLGFTNDYQNDKYHGRVMFPITSISGMVIGFGGRILSAANQHAKDNNVPKYINSPESEIYNKSKTLYGISQARNEITRKDECILVEGYTDVLSMHQAGITNVVASSGTSLTNDQINLIKRYTENIVIIYDGDNAGIKAAVRGIDMILEKDMNVRILLLPDGDDPDTFSHKHSAEEIAAYIQQNKTDFLTFRTQSESKECENDPIARSNFITSIASTIAKIPNSVKRAVYIQECSKILGIDEQSLDNQVKRSAGTPQRTYQTNQVQRTASPNTNTTKPVTHSHITTIDKEIKQSEHDIISLLIKYGEKEVRLTASDFFYSMYDSNENEKKLDIDVPTNILIYDILQKKIDSVETFTPINEPERTIYNTYYQNFDEQKENINSYLLNYSNPELIANILGDNGYEIDVDYWDKNKEKRKELKLKEQQDKEDTEISNLVKDTLLEYMKRRYKKKKIELTEKINQGDKESYATFVSINKAIDTISRKTKHTTL